MDDPDTRPERYMPIEEAPTRDHEAEPAGTSQAPGGGVRGSAAGGPGEGTPGGPVGSEPGDAIGEPPATDRVAYDDHADDFPDKRGAAGRSGVSPSEAIPEPGEGRASQPEDPREG